MQSGPARGWPAYGRSARSRERRNAVGELHAKAEPFLVQRIELATGLQFGDALVEEIGEVAVLLAESVAVPVVLADVVDDRESSRLVAQHDTQGRHGVEDAVHAALAEREVGCRVVVVGL